MSTLVKTSTMAHAKQYWLFKSEPESYGIHHLERDGRTGWEGVRNYQARNFLRDQVRVGDRVLFYHSNADPTGVAGVAEVVRAGYVDPLAFVPGHKYHDPKSEPDSPTWYTVDIAFVERFPGVVTLAALKSTPGLERMLVIQRGSRLSIQPVSRDEYQTVVRLAKALGR
jgi:predicted RNA-binding protein with PUA-like domain